MALAHSQCWATTSAAKSLQSCPTLCDPIDGSPLAFPVRGILHFLLQCRKMKSESEVAQSCPTLSDPIDCSLLSLSNSETFYSLQKESESERHSFVSDS